MPSISKMAAASLALTIVLFMPGVMAAAIQSKGLERCDFDSESAPGLSPASDAAKRQNSPDLDTTADSIFGRPPVDGDQKPGAEDLESIFGRPPSAGSDQDPSPEALEAVFGKPPASRGQQARPDDLEGIFGKPPSASQTPSVQLSSELLDSIFNAAPSASQDIDPSLLDSIFNGPPAAPQGSDADVVKDAAQAPAANDDGRMLKVGVYMHVVGNPENNESAEFFLSRSDLDKQIDAMNKYYTPANISFHLLDADWTRDTLLSSSRGLRTPLAHGLHRGSVSDLNMFWVKPASLRYGGTSKTFFAGGEDVKSDGVIIGANTVPGGSHPVMNLGVTGVHEAGHWFGLGHTAFTRSGDCEPNWLNNPGQGNEPCGHRCDNNFMSYGADACLTEFTAEQIKTMRDVAINKRGF